MYSLVPVMSCSSCVMDSLTPTAYLQTSGVGDSYSEGRFVQSDQDVALSAGGFPSNKTGLYQIGQLLPDPLHQHLAAHQDRAAWHRWQALIVTVTIMTANMMTLNALWLNVCVQNPKDILQGRSSCAEQAKGAECIVRPSHGGADPSSGRMGQGGVGDDCGSQDEDSLCRTQALEQWWWRETRRLLQQERTSKRCRTRTLPSFTWTGVCCWHSWYLIFLVLNFWYLIFGTF